MKKIIYCLLIIACNLVWIDILNASDQYDQDISDLNKYRLSTPTLNFSDIVQQTMTHTSTIIHSIHLSGIFKQLSPSKIFNQKFKSPFKKFEQDSNIILPNNIWKLIENYLGQNDVLRLGRTSIYLHNTMKDVWKIRFLTLSSQSLIKKTYESILTGDFCNIDLLYRNLNTEDIAILGKSITLKKLRLREAYIDDKQDQCLSHLTNLTELNWIHGKINYRNTHYLSLLTNLKKLSLVKIGMIDKSVKHLSSLTNLTDINLSSNNIVKTINLSFLINLTKLDLSGNKINNLNNLSSLTNLKTVDLVFCDLNTVPNLSSLTKITHLNLSYNEVQNLNNLSFLTQLTRLDLRYNRLEKTDIQNLSFLLPKTSIQY